jgi:hypothetical protein
MDQVIESGATDLIALLPAVPTVTTFTDEKEAERLYASIQKIVDDFKPDTATKTGRDAIKSLAFKVARVKTTIDNQGKELNADADRQIKLVNASRSKIWDRLEELQARARKPYDDWEAAEKARVAKHQSNLDDLLALSSTPVGKSSDELKAMFAAIEVMSVGEEWEEFKPRATVARLEAIGAISRLITVAEKSEADERELAQLRADKEKRDQEDADRRQKENAERAEAERVENERQAEEQRQADIAKAAQEATDKAAREAEQRIADAERKAEEATAQAARDITAAQAETDRKAEVERKRVADEAEAQRLRDEDVEHRRSVNSAIVARLIACSKITPDEARSVVAALVRGSIPHVTLQY